MTTATLARPETNMAEALSIYQEQLLDGDLKNHRQRCIKLFMEQLNHKPRTAATYYVLCFNKLNQAQQVQTEKVIESNRKTKFSAVKPQRGTDTAAHVHCFFSKKDAQAFNKRVHGFTEVVKGIQEPGKPIGTVRVA
jgi:hypothetical protein